MDVKQSIGKVSKTPKKNKKKKRIMVLSIYHRNKLNSWNMQPHQCIILFDSNLLQNTFKSVVQTRSRLLFSSKLHAQVVIRVDFWSLARNEHNMVQVPTLRN